MTSGRPNRTSLPEILARSPVRVAYGAGRLGELGAFARDEGALRVLLVSDAGLVAAGHVSRAVAALESAGLHVTLFDGARENPTTEQVAAGLTLGTDQHVDFIIGLGGGSSMDCAKGINILLTNGGEIADYWGVNKTTQPMLPMILVPTTAGTGSEAQSFALISDPATHQKMACGDRRSPRDGGLRPRVAILDPELSRTAPAAVAKAAGIDAISHAVETAGSNARNDTSRQMSREAWLRLERAFPRSIESPRDAAAHADMILGAHLAGAAIEQSMLGAAHACANPLTAHFGITHGVAVGLLLPQVVRYNAAAGSNPYTDLCEDVGELIERIHALLRCCDWPHGLRPLGVEAERLPELAEQAAEQWTARFNPRPVNAADLLEIYRASL